MTDLRQRLIEAVTQALPVVIPAKDVAKLADRILPLVQEEIRQAKNDDIFTAYEAQAKERVAELEAELDRQFKILSAVADEVASKRGRSIKADVVAEVILKGMRDGAK